MSDERSLATIAPRALQLDAHALDDSLHSLLLHEYRNVLRHFPSSVLSRLIPEVTFVLRLLFHVNTTFINKSTPGNALHSIVYRHINLSRLKFPQRLGLIFFDVFLPYIISRAEHFRFRFRASHPFSSLDTLVKLMSFFNLFIFLRRAVFSTLSHRILSIVAVHPRPTKPIRAAFEIVDSQLLFQGLAEFALFLAPVVRKLLSGGLLAIGAVSHHRTVDGVCVNCSDPPTMPHRAVPCGCLYCYICSRKTEGSRCVACTNAVATIERVVYS